MNPCEAMIALTQIPGLGPILIKRLLEHFAYSPQRVWEAASSELLHIHGIGKKVVNAMQQIDWNKVSEEYQKTRQNNIELLYYRGPDYPYSLLEIYDPPSLLYIKGLAIPQADRGIAIVGTRCPTTYGKRQAYWLARQLAERNVTIVSGLARGIDIAAHRGALDGGGRTLAVLGNGLDHIYPAEHTQIAHEICQSGSLISEYSMETLPIKYNFPQRNRIISGLSLGIIVIEGSRDSGALITADCALEQGREVFALPGEIGRPQSEGPHWLIQQGAKLITNLENVIEELYSLSSSVIPPKSENKLNEEERKIWEVLSYSPQPLEIITNKSTLSPSLVCSRLLEMEIRGLVQALPGSCYIRL